MPEPSDPNKPLEKELSGRIGKYDILRPLGKGAMGQVHLAHDTVLDRDVALKVMVAQIADDPELKSRFEREARAVAKMTHPNVVTVFDLGSHTDGSPFIAMELLKGQDLQKAVRQGAPMPLERKVAVVQQVVEGLGHAHQAGIVHRVLRRRDGELNEDVHLLQFLLLDELQRIEVLHLAGKAGGERRRIEARDRANPARTRTQGFPVRLRPGTDRCHQADTGHYDSPAHVTSERRYFFFECDSM